ncbi:phage protein NinX family protein [Enterobacter asburiae]|nr:DUF2591 family protein [Enterobacter asburiae]
MDYSQLSDFEINKCVAEIVYRGFDINHPRELAVIQVPENESDVAISIGSSREWRNYCNNPADAWPIIKENMISVCAYKRANPGMKAASWWEADSFGEHINRDENPFRAAMIVFLQMQDAKHA